MGEDLLAAVGATARDERARAEAEGPAQAFVPFDDAQIDRITDDAMEALRRPASGIVVRSPSLRPDRKTFPVGFVAGGALALAATLALVTGRGPTLPAYEVAVSGNVAATRGEPAPHEEATVRVTPQGTIDLVARPAQDVSGPLTAVAFLGKDGAPLRRWSGPVQVSAQGAVRIVGSVSALFGEASATYQLAIVLLPRPEGAAKSFDTLSLEHGARVVRATVVVAPAP